MTDTSAFSRYFVSEVVKQQDTYKKEILKNAVNGKKLGCFYLWICEINDCINVISKPHAAKCLSCYERMCNSCCAVRDRYGQHVCKPCNKLFNTFD